MFSQVLLRAVTGRLSSKPSTYRIEARLLAMLLLVFQVHQSDGIQCFAGLFDKDRGTEPGTKPNCDYCRFSSTDTVHPEKYRDGVYFCEKFDRRSAAEILKCKLWIETASCCLTDMCNTYDFAYEVRKFDADTWAQQVRQRMAEARAEAQAAEDAAKADAAEKAKAERERAELQRILNEAADNWNADMRSDGTVNDESTNDESQQDERRTQGRDVYDNAAAPYASHSPCAALMLAVLLSLSVTILL